jgi:isopentenyl diphosphate isomerase/L-lactate dehydrogenase-like FMN-dependent dehydrogenase
MNDRDDAREHKRRFLQWLAASPLLALPGLHDAQADEFGRRPDPMQWTANTDLKDLIKRPDEAVNVFDFEPVAWQKVPRAHFGYMASGIDDEVTLRANRSAFLRYQLRPRRMRDVSRIDTSLKLFGTTWKTPLIIAPTGGNRAHHPDGELAVARAARAGGYLNVLSTSGGTSIEEVVAARQGEVWYQLYATSSLEVAKQVVRRVAKAGVPVLEITVDRVGGRNQETFARLRKQDPRLCASCHTHGLGAVQEKPNFDGIDMSGVRSMQSDNMTWDFIQQMRDTTSMKLVLKGIVTEEDAELCLKYGVDGIHVSNHCGRSEDGSRATIDCLAEIARVARGKVPILFDSGVRRGSDIVKALAMGADAVAVGRPYLWGLGAFGQPGVEKVMDILLTELKATMQQVGAPSLAAIVPAMVARA